MSAFTDWPAWIVAGAAIVGPITGALIVYGRNSDRLSALGSRLDKLETKTDHDSDVALLANTGLARHEEECGRRNQTIGERFDRIERMLENLSAQITNVAAGRTGRIYEVTPRRPPKI